jgi:DNA-binding MarR family transcriptional regulator
MASDARGSRRAAVADALHSAAIHLLRGIRKEDERTGVTPGRLSALSVLVFAGPKRLTELARIEQVKAPTMTKIVAGLEAEGLVKRRADPRDARAISLAPTQRGTRLLHEGRRRRVERLSDALRELTPGEIDVLAQAADIMERLSRSL